MELKYIVEENDFYKNINEILSLKFNLSTRLTTKLIKNQKIYKNGNIVDTRSPVFTGDIILIDLNLPEDNSNIVPTAMKLDILYEDDWFLVVNKPAGIAIHPSRLHYDNSLSNGIRFYFDSIGLKKKIRPVNRLDLNTSGIVVFAKCEYIQESFSKQMADGIFKKEYLCVVEGRLTKKVGTIDLPISRKDGSIIERCIDKDGQRAITHYQVLKEFQNYSLVKCKLQTGRTHQIRVHMKAIGHPIVGDTLYGNASTLINHQALHSYKIECLHPVSKENLTFMADIPEDVFWDGVKKHLNTKSLL